MRATIRDLVKHVGGRPSATQSALIERAAMLTLHLALMDARIAERGAAPSERDGRQYLAWSNALTRLMRQLGPAAASASPTDLRDFLKQRANP